MENTCTRGLKILPWQSKMEVKSIPNEEPATKMNTMQRMPCPEARSWPKAESVELYVAADMPPPYGSRSTTWKTHMPGTEDLPWQSKMEVNSIPKEEPATQDDYDAEDASSRSKELAEGAGRRSVHRHRHEAAIRGQPKATPCWPPWWAQRWWRASS
ncbi:hypothetical protein VPH35_001625 [Triticum aestivum]